MTKLASLLVPAVLLTVLFGCAPQKEEKTLAIYNWADYFGETTIEDFQKSTGVQVQYDNFASAEVLETKLLAGKTGYDLVFPSIPLAERARKAGALASIDTSRLKNYANLDPQLLGQLARFNGGATLGVPYTWGTVGLGANIDKIQARLPDAPLNSLDLLFKPELAQKFADCGISMLDSPQEVFSVALNYLGLDPHSGRAEDIDKALALLMTIRPYVRYLDSTRPIDDLATGELCLSLIYSGDVGTAQLRADDAKNGVNLRYSIPLQGTILWMDLMSIPADAPHPEQAYAFIDYMLQPKVIAGVTNFLTYANANSAATPLVAEEIRQNPDIYPPKDVRDRLFADVTLDEANVRLRTRAWTKFKTGQ